MDTSLIAGFGNAGENRKHYVHSKMMSWVALDRAAKIARLLGRHNYVLRFEKFAEEIKQDILDKGYNEQMQSFVMCYGSDQLDASTLLMLHYRFLDRQDPKIISTVKQIYKQLVKNNFVFRYVES